MTRVIKLQSKTDKTFPCPRCKQPSLLDLTNPYRPFCSERCKLIDLGSWAAEEHKIASEPAAQVNLDTFDD